MTKYICDKCGKELAEIEVLSAKLRGSEGVATLVIKTHLGDERYDLCSECREKFLEWISE